MSIYTVRVVVLGCSAVGPQAACPRDRARDGESGNAGLSRESFIYEYIGRGGRARNRPRRGIKIYNILRFVI